MANITIKELLASDTVSDIVDKINFNFDQLLLNGGGPVGLTGGAGPIGPQGPRGTTWFTTRDLYNTSLTTTGETGYTFPIWSGTAELVDNPGQFNGDPNKYLPVATTSSPNTYPFYSFTFGVTGGQPRSGDLFLQEGDDTFDGYNSTDGDIWQYNAVANSWSFTGVNIKGDTGSTGSSGLTEWERTTDINTVDEIHPKLEAGHDGVVRVLIGTDDSAIIEDAPNEYTNNVVTIYNDISGYNLAFTDSGSTSGADTSDFAGVKTSNHILAIEGFNGASSENTYDVELTARSGSIILKASDTSLTDITLELDRSDSYPKFRFDAATINVTSNLNDFNQKGPVHWLTDGYNTLTIMHNTGYYVGSNNSTDLPNSLPQYTGWSNSNSIRINNILNTGNYRGDLIFQDRNNSTIGNVGIGNFSTGSPSAKLSIRRGNEAFGAYNVQPALSLGNNWSYGEYGVVGTNSYSDYLSNIAFFQTHIVVGATSDVTTYPSVFGGGTSNTAGANSITTDTNINIKSGIIGFNTFFDPGTGLKAMKTDSQYNLSQFIGSGDWLYNHGGTSGGSAYTPAGDDLFGTIVIGGNATTSTYNTVFGNSNLQTGASFKFNANLVVKSVSNQVGINTTLLQSSLNSYGGAIIGKTKTWSGATGTYHQDNLQANNNIIIGHPKDNTHIKLVNGTQGQANATWLTTPVWSASMLFNDNGESYGQTIASYKSFTADTSHGIYKDYLPSDSSQFKIIHGKNYTGSSATQLLPLNNPYNTGIGLEIENRVLTFSGVSGTSGSSGSSSAYTRTPIIKDASSNNITGHRPIVITKRPVYNSKGKYDDSSTFTIFEISPVNNVSVGKSINLPSKSVWKVIQRDSSGITITSNAPTGSVYQPNSTTITLTEGINSSKWKDLLTTPDYTSIILPEYNKSLHVSSIFPGGSLDDQYATDQFISKIEAGIVIDTGALVSQYNSSDNNWFMYNEYSTKLKYSPNNYSITSSIAFSNKGSAAPNTQWNLFANRPLGIKTGLTIFRNRPADPEDDTMAHIKGGDLLLSAGDVLYSKKPSYSLRPGDVFITGGHLYKYKIDQYAPYESNTSGATGPISDVNNFTGDTNQKVHGNIYLGSITGDSFGNNYDYISRTGSIYAGYDSGAAAVSVGVWNDSATGGAPVGNATLNISGYSSGSDLAANYDKREGKAINIQYGDIVTKNQDAGWIEVDLKNITNTFIIGSLTGDTNEYSGENLYPVAKFYYKVIGYTVLWKLTAYGIKFTATSTSSNQYRTILSFKIPNSIPVPFNNPIFVENTTVGVYRSTSLNNGISGTYQDYNYNFSGHGQVVLRNGNQGFPTNAVNDTTIAQQKVYSAPFQVSFETGSGNNYFNIYQIGPKIVHNSLGLFGSTSGTSGTINDSVLASMLSAQNWSNSLNLPAGFFPELVKSTGGKLWWSSENATISNNRVYYVDVSVSGQYELDPNQWF